MENDKNPLIDTGKNDLQPMFSIGGGGWWWWWWWIKVIFMSHPTYELSLGLVGGVTIFDDFNSYLILIYFFTLGLIYGVLVSQTPTGPLLDAITYFDVHLSPQVDKFKNMISTGCLFRQCSPLSPGALFH